MNFWVVLFLLVVVAGLTYGFRAKINKAGKAAAKKAEDVKDTAIGKAEDTLKKL